MRMLKAVGLLFVSIFSQSLPAQTNAQFVGSAACKTCHPAIYERWSKTRMANVVRDPKDHPEAILPDLVQARPAGANSRRTTSPSSTAASGSSAISQKGRRLFSARRAVGRHASDLARLHGRRRTPTGGLPFYPADNMQRPTGPLCDGCHSVNYDIQTKTVTEWNVGCEKCHGPGSEHVTQPSRANIVNPARLDYRRRPTTSASSATRRASRSAIRSTGKYYDWPVGFQVGQGSEGFLEAGRAQARRADLHPFRRRHRAQEPHAGQRFRPER